MVLLETRNMFAHGLHRECYIHPEIKTLCIKIITKGDLTEQKREQRMYKRLEKEHIPLEMIPKCHGVIDTSLGVGTVFDLIQDHNGEVSKTLEYYLASNEILLSNLPDLSNAFYSFKEYLLKNCIITMNLKPKNILYKKINKMSGKLFIVDSLGNSDFFPVSDYFTFLARNKIQRKWDRFERSLLNKYKTNEALYDMLNSHQERL